MEQTYVPHLPKLLKPKSDAENLSKNIDRSFSAFALDHICQLDPKKAAKSVVDDYEDYGIDAIYYHARTKTLYFVQAKLKETKSFNQDEALKFTHGVRRLVNGDFVGFNENVLRRESQIRGYLAHCDHIEIVVAHTGEGIHVHAEKAIQELLADKAGGEGRIRDAVFDFDAVHAVNGLHSVNAVEPVNCRIKLFNYGEATDPKIAYYGTVALSDLADLHKLHGKALYQKNIRTWLGHKTPVNESIQETLGAQPARFQYLNNGVTALCEEIAPKVGVKTEQREFELTGFSIINGAQTVASTANFVAENPDADISDAKVMITLIKADAEGDFGKDVTRARNHQNDVKDIAFAALDEEQERIRRELQHLDIDYVYRVGENPSGNDPNRVLVSEAILALAMLEEDPRYPIWMKQSLTEFQKTDGNQYRQIFSQSLSSLRLVNAVRVYRYINARVDSLVRTNWYEEKAAYKHGRYALAFILTKQLRDAINGNVLIDVAKLSAAGSLPMDELRQKLWDVVQSQLAYCGPLKSFRNPNFGLPAITKIMTNHYNLGGDPVCIIKAGKWVLGEPYQVDLFKYLAAKAPQIANVI
ncbi:AIPR family protein [Sphingopyxis bauzanensis]|uniref:AIPR family protein n=1 Tax=Sphingopyxis bauzanensis TaxID=651663 RepID=UPI001303DB34|nr:AIPR family protein [Sphingopyxis bauzanensis]